MPKSYEPLYEDMYYTLRFIANEPVELSQDKMWAQLCFWKRLAQKAIYDKDD